MPERKAPPPEKPIPDLTLNNCLVAFIDILGFGHEIEKAQTKQDMENIYHKVRLVQQEFQKESAAEDPEQQIEFNMYYGRRVIALSDAVVVVIYPKAPAIELLGPYDRLGMAINEMVWAQARCVAQHGIFVRGGISHGSFFFEDDILLSSALAKAYDLESHFAEQPIIVVPASTMKVVLGTPKTATYAPGADPTLEYFAPYEGKSWRGEDLFFLDYLDVLIGEADEDWTEEDRQQLREAKESREHSKVDDLRQRAYQKGAAYWLCRHREAVEHGCKSNHAPKVKRKYWWLMNYHNDSFFNKLEFLNEQVIDLTRFPEPEVT